MTDQSALSSSPKMRKRYINPYYYYTIYVYIKPVTTKILVIITINCCALIWGHFGYISGCVETESVEILSTVNIMAIPTLAIVNHVDTHRWYDLNEQNICVNIMAFKNMHYIITTWIKCINL